MALFFRKSKSFGPLRFTFSKSGVSMSVGGKFGRITTNSKGQTTVTSKIPGTGIYDRSTIKAPAQKQSAAPVTKGKKTTGNDNDLSSSSVNSSSLSYVDLMIIENVVYHLQQSASLVNSTVSPQIFFGRLHFILDAFLYLQRYEGAYSFGSATPTQNFNNIEGNLEATVNDFIDRYFNNELAYMKSLKTERGRTNRLARFYDKAIAVLHDSSSCWPGVSGWPHYEKPLFNSGNIEHIQSLPSEYSSELLESPNLPQRFSTSVTADDELLQFGRFCETLDLCAELGTSLVEMSSHNDTCAECSKYEGRVFSIDGRDTRFPRLPKEIFRYGGIHAGCRHSFFPYVFGSPLLCGADDPIAYSNRPFEAN